MRAPRVLLFGGVDPSGGAGLTTDVRMADALGVHALPVATCLTVQNRHGFARSEPTSSALLREAARAAREDGPVHSAKVGLLGTADQLDEILAACGDRIPIVVDPVLAATSGGLVAADAVVDAYRMHLGSIAVLTPNLPELARLGGDAEALVREGCANVFVTGGHGDGDVIEDVLHTANGSVTIRHARLDRGPVRGTGCALATSVAARLARGSDVEAACRGAVDDLVRSLEETAPSPDGLPVPLAVTASRSSA